MRRTTSFRFAQLQAVTAQQIVVDPALLLAANTAGGVLVDVVPAQTVDTQEFTDVLAGAHPPPPLA